MSHFGTDSAQAKAWKELSDLNPQSVKTTWDVEAVADASAYASMREYESWCEKGNKPAQLDLASEILERYVEVETDKFITEKGLENLNNNKRNRVNELAKKKVVSAISGDY